MFEFEFAFSASRVNANVPLAAQRASPCGRTAERRSTLENRQIPTGTRCNGLTGGPISLISAESSVRVAHFIFMTASCTGALLRCPATVHLQRESGDH